VPVDAGQILAVQGIQRVGRVGHIVDDHHAFAVLKRRLDRVGQAALGSAGFLRLRIVKAAGHQAVDHDINRVVLVAIQLDVLVDIMNRPVDPHANKPGLADVLEDLLMAPFAVLDHRGQNLDAATGRQRQDAIDDLLGALGHHFLPADRAVGDADAGVQQAQIVVDLGDRPDRRARVGADALLVDGHGRAEALDLVDIGLFHLPQELASVGAQAFHIAPLALGEDRIEGQGGLAGAGEAGDDHQLVAGNIDVDVLEVVLARTLDQDEIVGHRLPPLQKDGQPYHAALISSFIFHR